MAEQPYAVISSGGKQYLVQEGDFLWLEKLEGEKEYLFREVLLVVDPGGEVRIGQPYLEGVTVKAEIIEEVKGPKIRGFKYKSGSYARRYGHRQKLTKVRIKEISLS